MKHPNEKVDVMHVRLVSLSTSEWAILDSGADLSLIPKRLAGNGIEAHDFAVALQDARSGSLPT